LISGKLKFASDFWRNRAEEGPTLAQLIEENFTAENLLSRVSTTNLPNMPSDASAGAIERSYFAPCAAELERAAVLKALPESEKVLTYPRFIGRDGCDGARS
jgi:hypothetical protein